MTTYSLNSNNGALLTSAIASYNTFPAATKSRIHLVEIANLSLYAARVWMWLAASGTTPTLITADLKGTGNASGTDRTRQLMHGANDNIAKVAGYPLFPDGYVNLALPPWYAPAESQIWALTDYAREGTEDAAVLTTAEIVVAAAAAITYAATTVTDADAGYTASPNNADLVGRRIEAGTAYLIVTSNTATVVTGSDGWREMTTGLPYVNPNNGNLYPTSGGAGMGYTVLASMRDTREVAAPVAGTALGANQFVGHTLVTGAYNARRSVVCVGNNAGIATYGTTFQVKVGGWPTGLPTAGKNWTITSLVRLWLDWIEESA